EVLGPLLNLARPVPAALATCTLHSRWKGFRRFADAPFRGWLQWLHGAGLVEVDDRIELIRNLGLEIMAGQLGFGPIDHADGALQHGLSQSSSDMRGRRQSKQE